MKSSMSLTPKQLAIEYYFGDLQYWKLPKIAAQALEEGYDGPALRMLAWINDPKEAEMDHGQIDAAFREMGVTDAPISKERARIAITCQLAQDVSNGYRNVFEAATHLRIHLCEFETPSPELTKLWELAKISKNAPRSKWGELETRLRHAFSEFLRNNQASAQSD